MGYGSHTIKNRLNNLQTLSKVFTTLGAMSFVGMVFIQTVHAAEGHRVPGSRYTSGRAAALGGAFIPLADDGASALFYNPAGFGKIRQAHLEPINLQLQANSEYTNNVGLNFFKFSSLSSYAPTLNEKPGTFPGFSGALFPNFSFRGFGFGVLMQSRFAATSNGGNIRYRSRYQMIPAVGGAVRIASGVMRIGYSLQWVNQATGDITVPANSHVLGYNQGLAQGAAFSHNLGWALTLPFEYLPALNIVARNIGGARYTRTSLMPLARNSTGAIETEKMSIDASLSFTTKMGSGTGFNTVFEYKDALNSSGTSALMRTSFGLEFVIRDIIFVRGGLGAGYPTAGFGVRRKTGEFSLSWFSEETGNSFRSERDIRYVLHYAIRAF